MKKSIAYLSVLAALAIGFSGCGDSVASTSTTQKDSSKETHEVKLAYQITNTNAPKVYFTKDVTPEGLMKVYKALNQKLEGKTGIKVSFGGDEEQYLDPKLMKNLAQETKGTFLDTCGFTPPRDNPAGNLRTAEAHGFAAIAPIDILDKDGDVNMPVQGGYHLQYARTGDHINNYDTLIAVHRFKAHYIPIFGGNIKNISLSLGSLSGKAIIHSGGKNESSYEGSSKRITAESFADAAKGAMDYKKGRWAFINVLDAFEPKDDCKDTKNLGNIGILASLDPVAIDQAACDFTYGAAPNSAVRKTWEATHSTDILEYAEKIGVGKRHYQLIEVK